MNKIKEYKRESRSIELGYEEDIGDDTSLPNLWITIEDPDGAPFINIEGLWLHDKEEVDLLINLLEKAKEYLPDIIKDESKADNTEVKNAK